MEYFISTIESPIGSMIAVADQNHLLFLAFQQDEELKSLQRHVGCSPSSMAKGASKPIEFARAELKAYFAGEITEFQTPFSVRGTDFQRSAWTALGNIAFGNTLSYAAQAALMGREKTCRAVGNANRVNPISILIPCHRIITQGGKIGGYAGGIARKQWLLAHEKQVPSTSKRLANEINLIEDD